MYSTTCFKSQVVILSKRNRCQRKYFLYDFTHTKSNNSHNIYHDWKFLRIVSLILKWTWHCNHLLGLCFTDCYNYILLLKIPCGWSWSLSPIQCHEPPSIAHQALYLSDLGPYIYFSLPLYNRKGFDLGHNWMV